MIEARGKRKHASLFGLGCLRRRTGWLLPIVRSPWVPGLEIQMSAGSVRAALSFWSGAVVLLHAPRAWCGGSPPCANRGTCSGKGSCLRTSPGLGRRYALFQTARSCLGSFEAVSTGAHRVSGRGDLAPSARLGHCAADGRGFPRSAILWCP